MAEAKSAGGGDAGDEKAPFRIQEWRGVCFWQWDTNNEQCAICRQMITSPSIEYQANPTPAFEAGLKVGWGVCGHVFHIDCIQRWTKKSEKCPLCSKEWDMVKTELIPGYHLTNGSG